MAQLIVKDNALIEASYTLDLAEQRLILLAILEAREHQTLIQAGSLLRIHASSYINQFDVEKHTAYKVLKEAVQGLYETGFAYSKVDERTGKLGHYKSRWVDKIGYIDELGCVELVFASDVIPLITRLEKRFTEYDIDQISNLQSKYAVRLYELLIQWRSTGKTPVIELQELRNRLGLHDSEYQRIEALKRRVLNLAIEQINENTDIKASYEQHKQGRTITGFTFKLKQKATKQLVERDPNTIDWVNGTTDNESKLLTQKQADYFASKLANDSGFGSKFGGSGESMQAFVNRISSELQRDISKVAVYMPYLLAQGYGKIN